ncbi:hypothetical protein EX30DRAFT_325736 [Ascodesmis nigricans]|uniref:RING-type E3 ubiquitin transferase n=1 Tax=Ascodesmis nigricans TaxID=341454 RepID=A0A4S2N6D0_9PEZI|nr:hypothetical protein EX30DRAFT_325736 [Ascodesmis nigricans]
MPANSPSRLYLLLIILLLIILIPTGSRPESSPTPESDAAIKTINNTITALRNSSDTSTPLDYRFVAPPNATLSLSPVLASLSKLWRNTIPPSLITHKNSRPTVYRNATASVHGEWLRPTLTTEQEALLRGSNLTEPLGLQIIKDGDGTMTIGITESGNGEVDMVVRVKDAEGGREVVIPGFQGVHDYSSGEIVAVTSAEEILPWMWFREDPARWHLTRGKAVEWLEEKMKRIEQLGASSGAYDSKKCDYILWAQLHPLDLTKDELAIVEQELRNPTGVRLPAIPDVEVAVILWSPTCGDLITARELKGDKVEVFYSRVSMVGLGAAAVTAVQLALMIRQLEKSSTPSTIARVSIWTIIMLGIQDGYWFFVFMTVAIYLEGCFLPLVTASFFYLILLTIFEMPFLSRTYRVQRPEPSTSTTQHTTLPAPAVAPTPLGLPAPATANTPNQTPAQRVNAEISAIYTRFYFFLVVSLFFTLQVTSWQPFYRDMFLRFLFTVVNSFWIPQITRNIYRGSRRPFTPEFIIGTSLCRLAPAAYLYLYEHNVFGVLPHQKSVMALAAWQAIQCAFLGAQAVFGSRFAIPSVLQSKLPSVWDYHNPPYLFSSSRRGNGEEAHGLLGEPDEGDAEEGFGDGTERDCAVCMQPVQPVRMDAGLMERRKFMWTPCKHEFHTECLEGWLRYRLQCPVCRTSLPPL